MSGLPSEIGITIWVGIVLAIADQCRNNPTSDLELDGLRVCCLVIFLAILLNEISGT